MEKVVIVGKDLVPFYWPQIMPLVSKVKDNTLTNWEIRGRIMNQSAEFHLIIEKDKLLAFCYCEASENDYMVVMLSGEGMDDWGSLLLKSIRDRAKSVKKKRILVFGRRAWKKLLVDFKEIGVIMEMKL